MAGTIKGITIEIGGNTTKLSKALANVNRDIKGTQDRLKGVNKLLKIDPTNSTLIEQKMKLLGESISKTKDKLVQLKSAKEQMDAGLKDGSISTQQYDDWQREIEATEIQLKNLEKQVKETHSLTDERLRVTGEKLQKAGGKMQEVGGKLTKSVTVPIVAVGTASVAAASDFESSFAKLSTIANTDINHSGVAVDDLKGKIMSLSEQTGMSSAEIAEAAYNAISAGQDTGDAIEFVGRASKLATAGFTDMNTATDTLTTILNAYGLEATEVGSVSDKLITTQNLGKTTVAELGSSMGKVIPTAAMFGVSIDELASAYVTTTKNGIATAESGTYINSMLNELGKSGKKASDVLQQRTGKSFKELMDSGYNLKDVLGILKEESDATGKSMADMFGSAEAGKAAATLSQHSDDFTEALGQMANSAGTTEEAFKKMEDTTQVRLKKLKTSFQNLGIVIGETILPIIQPVIEKLKDLLDRFREKWQSLSPGVQKFIIKLAGVAAAVGPVLVVFGKITSGVGGLLTNFTAIKGAIAPLVTALGGIAGPVLIVIGVIAALGAAFVILYKKNETFRNSINETMTKIKDGFAKLQPAFEQLKTALLNFWNTIKPAVEAIVNLIILRVMAVVNGIKNAIEPIMAVIQNVIEFISNITMAFTELFKGNFEGFFTHIVAALKNYVDIFLNIIKAVLAYIDGFLQTYGINVKEIIQTVMEFIHNVISTTIETIKTTVETVSTAIRDTIETVWNGIKDTTSTVWNAIKDTISRLIDDAKTTVENAVEDIKNKVTNIWDSIRNTTERVWDGIKNAMIRPVERAKDMISNAIDRIKSIFSNTVLSLDIKLPHINMSPGRAPFGIGGKGYLPSFSVEWYKDGGILTNPTIFGMQGGKLLGGGEAGPEAVLPLSKLDSMITSGMKKIAGEMNTGNTEIRNEFYIQGDNPRQIAEEVSRILQRQVERRGKAWA